MGVIRDSIILGLSSQNSKIMQLGWNRGRWNEGMTQVEAFRCLGQLMSIGFHAAIEGPAMSEKKEIHSPISHISPDGNVVLVEMETIREYKSTVESLRKRYNAMLLGEVFFDEVIAEGFVPAKFTTENSNTM